MDRLDELVSALHDVKHMNERKKPNIVAIVILCLVIAAAVAAAIYAIYRFTLPKYDDEDFDFDSDDDFDDFFEDEEEDLVAFEEAEVKSETLFED